MTGQIEIYILNFGPTVSAQFLHDEGRRARLDLPDGFRFRVTRTLETLTELNQIGRDGVLSFSVPYTADNDQYFERYRQENWAELGDDFFEVEVISGGRRLPFDRLNVLSFDDARREYEVELYAGHWVEGLKSVSLADIDFGDVAFTKPAVVASWSTPDAPFTMPLIHYGATASGTGFTVQDFRPILNILKILNDGFCAAGWAFVSPLISGAWGRRLCAYLLKPTWWDYPNKCQDSRVEVETSADYIKDVILNRVIFDTNTGNTNQDPLGLFQLGTLPGTGPSTCLMFAYSPANTVNVRGHVSLTVNQPPPPLSGGSIARIRLQFYVAYSADGTNETWRTQIAYVPLPLIPWDFTFNFDEIFPLDTLNPALGYFYVNVFASMTDSNGIEEPIEFTVKAGSEFKLYTHVKLGWPTDVVPANLLVDEKLNVLQVLQGVAHMVNAKFETDWVAKTVQMMPAFLTDLQGETVDGFFKTTQPEDDFTAKIVSNSRRVTVSKPDRARFYELAFASSKDAWIKQIQPGQKTLYAKTFDAGRGEDKTDSSVNPFFTPTSDILCTGAESGGSNPPTIPALWDNEPGEIAHDIQPRIFWNYGLIRQHPFGGVDADFDFHTIQTFDFGFVSQFPLVETTFGAPEPLIYGERADDLFSRFYENWVQAFFQNKTWQFLVNLESADFWRFNFRNRVGIFYNGQYLKLVARQISDFDDGGLTATPVDFIDIDC